MSHEALTRHEPAEPPSERSFAVVFTVFFTLVALWPLVKGRPWRPWALSLAAVILIAGWLAPSVLRVPNLLWFKLALLLNRVVSPVVIGLLFFVVVTPFAVVLRWLGKDLLRLRPRSDASTYWIDRNPPGPPPESMVEQF